jgi:hypothetical protein
MARCLRSETSDGPTANVPLGSASEARPAAAPARLGDVERVVRAPGEPARVVEVRGHYRRLGVAFAGRHRLKPCNRTRNAKSCDKRDELESLPRSQHVCPSSAYEPVFTKSHQKPAGKFYACRLRPGGEIGIHGGLKIRCPQGRVGSNPTPGTPFDVHKSAVARSSP